MEIEILKERKRNIIHNCCNELEKLRLLIKHLSFINDYYINNNDNILIHHLLLNKLNIK